MIIVIEPSMHRVNRLVRRMRGALIPTRFPVAGIGRNSKWANRDRHTKT